MTTLAQYARSYEFITSWPEKVGRNQVVSSRGVIHAAVTQRLEVDRIISADTDFDRLEGLDRLDPARTKEWQSVILSTEEGSSGSAL